MPVTGNLSYSWHDTPNIHLVHDPRFRGAARRTRRAHRTRRRARSRRRADPRQRALVGVESLRRTGRLPARARQRLRSPARRPSGASQALPVVSPLPEHATVCPARSPFARAAIRVSLCQNGRASAAAFELTAPAKKLLHSGSASRRLSREGGCGASTVTSDIAPDLAAPRKGRAGRGVSRATTAEAPSLRDLPLFSMLDEATLARLTLEAKVESYSDGAVIFRQGDPVAAVVVILRGYRENPAHRVLRRRNADRHAHRTARRSANRRRARMKAIAFRRKLSGRRRSSNSPPRASRA